MSDIRFDDVIRILDKIPDDPRITMTGSESLYHYTSANGLLGIITTNSINLSNLRYLNDENELEYSKKIFLSVLDDILKVVSEEEKTDICENFKRNILDYSDDIAERLFVFSTSFSDDNLHLWNYYGKNDGYAIEFSVKDLLNSFYKHKLKLVKTKNSEDNEYSIYNGKVIYDLQTQRELLEKYIKCIISLIHIGQRDKKINEANRIISKYRHSLIAFMFNMKENYNNIESEYRICIIPNKGYLSYQYTNKHGIIVPYVKLKKRKLKIKGIKIGPMIKDDIAHKGIDSIVKNLNIKCTISKSLIKQR